MRQGQAQDRVTGERADIDHVTVADGATDRVHPGWRLGKVADGRTGRIEGDERPPAGLAGSDTGGSLDDDQRELGQLCLDPRSRTDSVEERAASEVMMPA